MSPERIAEVEALYNSTWKSPAYDRHQAAIGELLEEVERLQADRDSWRRVAERLQETISAAVTHRVNAAEIDPDEIDRELAARPRRFTHVLRGRLEPVADQPEEADIAECRAQLARMVEQRRQAEHRPDPRGDDEWVGEDPSEWTVNAPPGAVERVLRGHRTEVDRDSWRRVCERLEGENRALRLELQGHREARAAELGEWDRQARALTAKGPTGEA